MAHAGIRPGYELLNGRGFEVQFKLCGERDSVTFGKSGFKKLLEMLKRFSYFQHFTVASEYDEEEESEIQENIMVTELSMSKAPCFKILNQTTRQSVVIGSNSIEVLLQKQSILMAIFNKKKVEEIQKKFLHVIEDISFFTSENCDIDDVTADHDQKRDT